MARPREFDIDEALIKSMQVFWSKGYEATSMSDIMEATNLQKGSIYKAFNDKHSLYVASLKYYLEAAHEFDKKHLENTKTPKKAILNWLNDDLKSVCDQTIKRGCLMVNALNEMAYVDEEIELLVNSHLSSLESLLTKTIKQGQSMGEFRQDLKPQEIAR